MIFVETMEQFKHRLPLQIRMNDIDFLGHANNAKIMEYLDLGRIYYFRELGIITDLQKKSDVVIVHHEIDFVNQILFNDEVFVETRTERFGNKSMQMVQRIIDNEGIEKVRCKTILSGIDHTTNTSKAIPDSFKQMILDYEESGK